MFRQMISLALSAVFMAACSATPSAGTNSSPSVGTDKSTSAPTVADKADIQGRWWTWAATEPSKTNPVKDMTGEFCARNQPADVWFLAGTFGQRARRICTVPQGRPIVIPVLNLFSSEPRDCTDFMADATGTAELDGAALSLDRITAEPIVFTAAAGNALDQSAGTFRATGCGIWARIVAPAPGTHRLNVRGTSGDFSVSVDYDLTIV